MALELACTSKLLKEFGARAASLSAPSLDGMDVWYADLFFQKGRKCVLLRNPKTGLIGLYPFVNREQIRGIPTAWPFELASLLRELATGEEFDSLIAGIPSEPCMLCRSNDKSSLASMVQLRPDLKHQLKRAGDTDPMGWARKFCVDSATDPIGPNYSHPLDNLRDLAARKPR